MRRVGWGGFVVLVGGLMSGVAAAQTPTPRAGDVTLTATTLTVAEGGTIQGFVTFHGKTGGTVRTRVRVLRSESSAVYRVDSTTSTTDNAVYDVSHANVTRFRSFMIEHRGSGDGGRVGFTLQVNDDDLVEDAETLVLQILTDDIGQIGADSTGQIWGVHNQLSRLTYTIPANGGGSEAFLPNADVTTGEGVSSFTRATEGETVNVVVGIRGESRRFSSFIQFSITGTATTADYEVQTDSSGHLISFEPDTATGVIRLYAPHNRRNLPIRLLDDGPDADETLIVTLTGHTGSAMTRTADSTPQTFRIAESPDTAPVFDPATQPDQAYTAGASIANLVLPAATGGNGDITYTLAPAIATVIPGLAFDADTRVVSGTPSAAAAAVTLTYTAADSDTTTTAADTDTLTFSITVVTPPTAVTISPPTLAVDKGGIATYTVALATAPVGTVTLTPTITPAGPDLTLTPSGALTFTSATWNTAQTLTVAAAADTTNDTVTIRYAVSGYGSVTTAEVIVRVRDPDAIVPMVLLSPESLTVNEGGRPGIYTARLSAPPLSGENAIIAAMVDDGDPLTISPSPPRLTFGSGNWSVPQAFTVTVMADTNFNDERFTVTHTATGGGIDPGLSDISIARLTVTLGVRDLPAGVRITPERLAVNQEGNGHYTVTLDAAPDAGTNVRITPRSGDPSVATVSAPLIFSADNWETPQRVEIRGVGGGATDITNVVTHGGNYTRVLAGAVAVTVSETVTDPAADAINRVILPEITRAMSAPQTGAIARRVGQARSGAGGIDSPGGYSVAAWAAEAVRAGAANGNEFDGKALLGASDFVLPLGAADGGGMLDAGAAMWGGGEFLQLGGKSGNIEWDGDLLSVNAGIDGKLQNDLLAGLMLSWNEARVGYIDDTTDTRERGDYDLDMVSVHPYIGTSMMDGRLDWWATLGFGSGDLEIRNKTNNTSVTSDVTLQMLGIGGNSRLLARGDGELRLRAEAFTTRTEVEGSKSSNRRLSELKTDARRVRLALQARKAGVTVGGGLLEPSMELGYRYDGGDGETGGGIEVGGALRYIDTERGLTLEGYTRALMSHSGDYDEIGLGGHLRLAQGADGQGLSLSLTPGYGSAGGGYGGGAEEIWQNGLSDDTETDLQAHLNARVGYGLSATAFMLTPYGEMALGEEVQNYRLGLSWGLGALFDLNLVGEREESDSVGVEHAIWLKGEMRF